MDERLIKLLSVVTSEEKKALLNHKIDTSLYSSTKDSVIKIRSVIGDKKIGLRVHTRFAPFPEHRHDYTEIIYICKGHITHHFGDKVILLSEGNLLFMNKNVEHSIEQTGKEDIGINILLSDDFISQLIAKSNRNSIITQFLTRCLKNDNSPEFLLFAVGDCIPIQNILSNLVYSLAGKHHDSPSIVPDNFSLLINYLTIYDEALKISSLSENKDQMLQNYISEYIDNNYKTASLKELAILTHYSESYLSRYIRNSFQENFINLVSNKRIEVAKDLLKTSNLTIQEVISSVGYSNRYHFITTFKRKCNCTPSQYMKQIR